MRAQVLEEASASSAPQPEELVSICAWCPGFDPKDEKNAGASHGMCPRCAAQWKEEEPCK